MSELIESTPQKELFLLLRQIHERELALPDFQRNFVWDPSATESLIVSVASNFPAGSLLTIRNPGNLFRPREVQGAPPLDGTRPTYLVLDGQQRLTSLYQAFYGKGEHTYFLKVGDLADGEDFDDSIFHVRTNAKRGWHSRTMKRYGDLEGQASDLVAPLAVLAGKREDFSGWIKKVARLKMDLKERESLEDRLDEVYRQHIRPIEFYKFPMVLLSDSSEPAAVCTIFETLNKTGVKLGVFDLLTARFWSENVLLRDMWEDAQSQHSIMSDFGIDPYYILQSIALLKPGKSRSCKRKDVLNLDAAFVDGNWRAAVEGLAEGLTILRDDCGVLVPKWLPYNTILVPLAAILAKHQTLRGVGTGTARQKVVRWFWNSVFQQTYESSPNSQAALDVDDVTAWLAGKGEPRAVAAGFKFDPATLHDVTPSQRAVYRGTIALILSGYPKDFHKGNQITRSVIETDKVDDHHVFPNKHLQDAGVKQKRKRDCVLNRTLIDRETNQRLKKRAPSDYFGEMRKAMGDTKCDAILKSHMLPQGDKSPLLTDDYETFLSFRQKQIGDAIVKATA